MAPIVSTAFDTRERPRRLPITLSEHAWRASWAPAGAADVSRCERTAPSREDQDAPRTARPALAVATSDERRRRPTRVGAGPPPTRRRRHGRRRAEAAPGLAERPRPLRSSSGTVRVDDARDPPPPPRRRPLMVQDVKAPTSSTMWGPGATAARSAPTTASTRNRRAARGGEGGLIHSPNGHGRGHVATPSEESRSPTPARPRPGRSDLVSSIRPQTSRAGA